ncbi:MAG: LytTR family DNA-binding domain-containing protein [Lachnospiraceae bacterium]|nr:LytTR family DNA-binding domain-containing protein [Lachnospiraceae bacterium]
MSDKTDIKVQIDPACKEPVVIIRTDRQSALVEKLIYAIEHCIEEEFPRITAYNGDTVVLLNQRDIFRVYTENRKLTICTQTGNYESRMSLRELEDVLQEEIFVRISRFELINLRKVSGFDMTVAGTIRVIFEDGTETWVARRNVHAIQQKLTGKA